MKLVPRFAVGSAVGVAFLVGLFVLLLVSDTLTGSGLILLAAVIGVFWGAPLVARELEQGTQRLVWTQSVTRRRWFSTKETRF